VGRFSSNGDIERNRVRGRKDKKTKRMTQVELEEIYDSFTRKEAKGKAKGVRNSKEKGGKVCLKSNTQGGENPPFAKLLVGPTPPG